MTAKRLAILTTHPIQYQAPWFRGLAQCRKLDIEVYFCHQPTGRDQADAGFGVEFQWDTPILSGYQHYFLKNVASQPSIGTFRGLDVPEIHHIIAKNHYDAVVVSGWNYKGAWQAFYACWTTRTPVMVRGDSHLSTARHPLKRLIKYPFYKWFLRRMDACLAVGTMSRDYFLHYGADPDRIFQVPHTIDETRFEQDKVRLLPLRNRLRDQYGFSPRSFVVAFCGKLTNNKRPTDFVEAIAAAHKRNPHIVGLVIGDGALRETCEKLAKLKGIPIQFVGFLNQAEITAAYVLMDCLVLPSDGETWGMVVNEAMYFGRPCIVSDKVGCAPDIVISGKTGDIFKVGDKDQLTDLIVYYASNDDLVSSLGEHAKTKIAAYSVEAAVNGLLNAIERIVK